MTRLEEYALDMLDKIDFSDELAIKNYTRVAEVCFGLAEAFVQKYTEVCGEEIVGLEYKITKGKNGYIS